MPSTFTRIINGEIPGQLVWRDDTCVAFLSIGPLRPGHALVVPIVEIDHWLDLDAATVAHMTTVAHTIGRAQMLAFAPARVGLIIAGLEVPHAHLHVVPIDSQADLNFANARSATPDELARVGAELRAALAELGHPLNAP